MPKVTRRRNLFKRRWDQWWHHVGVCKNLECEKYHVPVRYNFHAPPCDSCGRPLHRDRIREDR